MKIKNQKKDSKMADRYIYYYRYRHGDIKRLPLVQMQQPLGTQ